MHQNVAFSGGKVSIFWKGTPLPTSIPLITTTSRPPLEMKSWLRNYAPMHDQTNSQKMQKKFTVLV